MFKFNDSSHKDLLAKIPFKRFKVKNTLIPGSFIKAKI
jgi:hypothetical protein